MLNNNKSPGARNRFALWLEEWLLLPITTSALSFTVTPYGRLVLMVSSMMGKLRLPSVFHETLFSTTSRETWVEERRESELTEFPKECGSQPQTQLLSWQPGFEHAFSSDLATTRTAQLESRFMSQMGPVSVRKGRHGRCRDRQVTFKWFSFLLPYRMYRNLP